MVARKPDQLKLVSGTFRADRAGDLPRIAAAVPRPPASLSQTASCFWKELAGLLCQGRVLTVGDRQGLVLLCEALALHRERRRARFARPCSATSTSVGSSSLGSGTATARGSMLTSSTTQTTS